MDPLALPSKKRLREIAAKQESKEKELRRKREAEQSQAEADPKQDAAQTIQVQQNVQLLSLHGPQAHIDQRNYRGYRQRRELRGHGLSTTSRWTEAVKRAHLHNNTRPHAKTDQEQEDRSNSARSTWKKAAVVARQAQNDDTSDTDGEEDMTKEDLERHRESKRKKKAEREEYAKTMGLEYFLEMVDQKHRYGSSLRKYHAVWQQSESKDNFFYWLDYGDGLKVDLQERPRKRLDEEQIRYLSREERKRYLVEIDRHGHFRWARNGELITTSPDYKDSIEGIVPADSQRPSWREVQQAKAGKTDSTDSSDDEASDASSISGISTGSHDDANHYANQELHDAKGLNKLKHVSAGALMNRLLRKTTKKNTWIFVCDTSCRIYLGIKQSGAFQHSSFLHGGRVFAAGLIRIKHGQVRKLDPLSGHYAPPTRNFRGFVQNLKDRGTDMSRVSISRSYALILGLEGYVRTKKSISKGGQKVKDLANPEKAQQREAAEQDRSESAKKERLFLEEQRSKEQANGLGNRLYQKLSLGADRR